MKEISKIMRGVDLTKPKLSPGWMIVAVFSVVAILACIAAGTWIFNKAKDKAAPVTGAVTGGISQLVD